MFFTDLSGDVLTGVEAWIRSLDDSSEFQAIEENRGGFSVPVSGSSQRYEVVASKTGFQTLATNVVLRDHVEERLILAPGGAISGSVTDSEGNPVGNGPLVLAYPDQHRPSLERLVQAIDGRPSGIALVRADRNGQFTIEGLATDLSYSLVAGGNGVASPEPTRAVASGTTGVQLKVEVVFGLRLVFEGLPQGAPSLWLHPGPVWTWEPDPGYHGIGTDSPIALLAGLDLEDTRRAPRNSIALLFVGAADRYELGPIHFSGTLAGYEPLNTDFRVPRSDGRLQDVHVELSPVAREWGSVSVRFLGAASGDGVAERVKPMGSVRLDSLDGGVSFEHKLVRLGSLTLDHVPSGSYIATLDTEAGYSGFPASEARISVSPLAQAEIHFDLSKACEVELAVVRRSGDLFGGEATFHVKSQESGRSQYISFARGPYRIAGLIPGRYSIRIYEPFHDKTALGVDLSPTSREGSAVFQEL